MRSRNAFRPWADTIAIAAAIVSVYACCRIPERLPGGELDADWLDGTTQLDAARFHRILGIVSRVPEGKTLVDRAVARLGHGDEARLATRFAICGPTDAPGLSGKTDYIGERLIVTRGEQYAAEIASKKSGPDVVDVRVTEGPDYSTIERWLAPRICVQPGLRLRVAAETVAHELEHALFRDPRVVPMDPATTTDPRAYAIGYVQIPGDEVDAHVVGARVRIALDGDRRGLKSALEPLLDVRGGPLVPRARLAQAVVDPSPEGLGYGSGLLRSALANARLNEARFVATKRSILTMYATAQGAFASQLAAVGQNSRAATSRAAEARLQAEIPALDARLRLLGAS